MNKKDNLAKNTLMLSAGSALSKGIQFLLIIFASSWLSVESYGIFDVMCTYVTLLLPVLSLSTGEAVFRFSASAKSHEERSIYITDGFLLVGCNFGICAGIFIVLSSVGVLSSALLWPFLFLLGSQLFNHYLQAFLRAVKKLNIYATSNVIFTIMAVVFSAFLVKMLHFGLEGLICAYAAGYAVTNIFVILSMKFWKYIAWKNVSKIEMKRMICYSLPLVPNDISWWVLNVSDRQIILVVLGAAANGIYAIANKIPALCSSIFGMFTVSWQQSIVEKIEETDWQKYANRVYNQMLVILLTLCSGVVSVTFFFYFYIFNIKYHSGMVYVPVLMTAIIFSSLMLFFGGIQIALKRTKENGITNVVGAVINLIVNIAFIRFIGLYAAAVSTLVSNVAVTVLRQYRLRKYIRFQVTKKTVYSLALYGYFILSFYLFQGKEFFEWMNILLSGIVFFLFNFKFFRSFLRK